MNRISGVQFVSMLLITDAFTLFCLMGSISAFTAAGFAAGTVLQLILAFPLVNFYRNGGTLKNCGKIVEIFYFVYIVLWGGMLFSMLWNTSDVIYIPYENGGIWGKLLISGLIALSCLYISSLGIKSLSRSAVIASAIGVLCLMIFVLSALSRSDWGNIRKLNDSGSFLRELVKGFAISGSMGSMAVLAGFARGDILDNIFYYFTGKILLNTIFVLTSVLVAGGIMRITDFPIVTAAQISQPFPVQRIDSLFLIIFSVFAVFSIAVQAVGAIYLLERIFPSFRKYKSTFVLIIMVGSAFLFQGRTHYSLIYALMIIPVLLTLPTAGYIKMHNA